MKFGAPTGWWAAMACGAAVGATCAALFAAPPVRELERALGLSWSFALRGPVTPPEQVVIVQMSRGAAARISLPEEPGKFLRCQDVALGLVPLGHVALAPIPARWPRCLHAQLVERLSQAGAAVIAFDVLFRERPPSPETADGDMQVWQDENLATAIESSARVVIARKLEAAQDRETLSALSPAIETAALGAAPMPLVPDSSRRIDRFLTFTDSDPATATLPALALQAQWLDAYARLAGLLARQAGDFGRMLPPTAADVRRTGDLQTTALLVHRLFRDDPTLAPRVLADLERPGLASTSGDLRRQVRVLVSLYGGEEWRLLNFYGGPGSIRTIAYDEALAATPERMAALFRDRAVFVGYGELDQPEQVEHFATPVSSAAEPDLSGVEIAATAFANLLRDESLREVPLRYSIAIVFLAGLLSTVIGRQLGYRAALVAIALLLAAYGVGAFLEFAANTTVLPIVVPMFVAAPAGMLVSFTWNYWVARRQREQLRRAFAYFVPREVVGRLERNAEDVGKGGELLECACVATDAANYTPLAETMSPERLTEFLNRYYAALFGGVASGGGFVSDVVGDAMLAIWPKRAPDMHTRMLNSLVEMRDAAERFGELPAGDRLVTRFGVDFGRVALTTVGAGMHYEYRAVGDAVNTATRIQELNKRLGTRVLVSQPAIGGAAPELLTRDLGRFYLRGKRNPVHVFELLGRRTLATRVELDLCESFAEAIAAINGGENGRALALFRDIQSKWPTDGPTKLYLHALQSGVALRDGALRLD